MHESFKTKKKHRVYNSSLSVTISTVAKLCFSSTKTSVFFLCRVLVLAMRICSRFRKKHTSCPHNNWKTHGESSKLYATHYHRILFIHASSTAAFQIDVSERLKNGRYHSTRTKGVASHVDCQCWFPPVGTRLKEIPYRTHST